MSTINPLSSPPGTSPAQPAPPAGGVNPGGSSDQESKRVDQDSQKLDQARPLDQLV